MEQNKQPNKDFMNQSLVNQIADLSIRIAEREAVITEQYMKLQELEKEITRLRDEKIKELDKQAEEAE